MTTIYTRDGITYRSYVTDAGGFEAFGRVLMAAHAYEDLGVPVTHVVLRSVNGRSLDRLRNDEIVPPAGAVVLTSDSNGSDDEAWSVLHEWALRHGVTRVVSVLVCPREISNSPCPREEMTMEWKHSVGPAGHDWWDATCGAWRLSVINSGPSGRWEWLVESDGEGPEPLPSWSGMSATVGEEGRIWAQAEAAHALERAIGGQRNAGSPDDLRALGFEVTAHVDYQHEGKPRVFWCLTLGSLAFKATGATDAEALDGIRRRVAVEFEERMKDLSEEREGP